MGIKELGNVKPSEVIATFTTERLYGITDPVCRLAKGDHPNTVVILDGDSFRPRLGTLEIEPHEGDVARIGLKAETPLAENPALLNNVVQYTLELAGVEAATIRPEVDTNLSTDILQMAGATALPTGMLEFHQAA